MARKPYWLGSILGIPVGLDSSWFLVFCLLTWMLADNYYPAEFSNWPPVLYWIMGAVTALSYFACILLHEMGHSVVALWYRIRVNNITLFMFGGVAQIEGEAPSAFAEFLIAIAGPLVSFILAFAGYSLLPVFSDNPPLLALIKYLAYINLALGLFNLVPGYPLDGGRIFRAIVWGITGNARRATFIAARVGQGFAYIFILFGIREMFSGDLGGGLWTIFLGWFLKKIATTQLRQLADTGR
ncbi:site-2 protease family protein [Ferrovum sp.]|uniref:site-2 protease family protein n=1 Tax=Ferrovum sp. TaxID=2609467 RepID=UPI002610442A|nr:site-2 protease family protein [Ferrovum sp.]